MQVWLISESFSLLGDSVVELLLGEVKKEDDTSDPNCHACHTFNVFINLSLLMGSTSHKLIQVFVRPPLRITSVLWTALDDAQQTPAKHPQFLILFNVFSEVRARERKACTSWTPGGLASVWLASRSCDIWSSTTRPRVRLFYHFHHIPYYPVDICYACFASFGTPVD